MKHSRHHAIREGKRRRRKGEEKEEENKGLHPVINLTNPMCDRFYVSIIKKLTRECG